MAEMANPFMDAGQGMGEVNPFMAQQAMMGQPGYNGYNQYGQPNMPAQVEVANPFGDYSSMGYQAQNNMMYYGNQQTPNQYYDQYGQMAHMNTNTNIVPSNVSQPPASMAGAALFGVEPAGSCSMSIASSPPEANPFLSGTDTPHSTYPTFAPDSRTQTPASFNPFADEVEAQPEPSLVQPIMDSEVTVEDNIETTKLDLKLGPDEQELMNIERPQSLVTEMVGGLEVSTTDMLQKLEIAKTPVIPRLEERTKDESDSESETDIGSQEKSKITEEANSDLLNIEPVAEGISLVVTSEEQEPSQDPLSKSEFGETSEQILSPPSSENNGQDESLDPGLTDQRTEEIPEPAETEVEEAEQEAESISSDTSVPNVYQTGGTAAGLFDDLPDTPAAPPILSTGDALFSDLPSVPNIKSTGAAIFGLSDESAAGTTGAALFDIVAPEPSKPCHGEMSGWDENFDKMFEKAEMQAIAAPVDAFGGPGVNTAAAFGYGAPPSFGEDPNFGDSFGMLPVTADLNNPFLAEAAGLPGPGAKTGDGEDPESPLFDSDVSKPLEPFPRLNYKEDCWEMFIRHPPKKKITAQRYWKKVFVRIANQGDNPAILLFDAKDAKEPFQELPLQAAYSLSDISHQVFDQYSKVFTIKLQYIFYKERAGIRPGQVSKMQKLTDKIGFLAKAVEDADYQGVKEFASDMKKLGVPLEHAPQISELLKLASYSYEDMKQFSVCIEERLFRIDVKRDRALTYKTEEVQMTAVDEVYVEQSAEGSTLQHVCRVRVFFLSFLSGMPEVDLGVNDMTRMGLEVVGRHDILPVPTEQWIRYEDIEFHSAVNQKAFEAEDHIIKFQPPDGCYIEVMRFRTRPPRSRELPMQARCTFIINGNKVEIRADIMVPYHATKAWGQVPCEDVAMRIPLPECWIYQFRTEKHNLSLSQVLVNYIFTTCKDMHKDYC